MGENARLSSWLKPALAEAFASRRERKAASPGAAVLYEEMCLTL
jgi:hypothetical protein